MGRGLILALRDAFVFCRSRLMAPMWRQTAVSQGSQAKCYALSRENWCVCDLHIKIAWVVCMRLAYQVPKWAEVDIEKRMNELGLTSLLPEEVRL